jgi:hypothetical protein
MSMHITDWCNHGMVHMMMLNDECMGMIQVHMMIVHMNICAYVEYAYTHMVPMS